MNKEFLNQILSQISVSGYEEKIQRVIMEHMDDYADRIDTDEICDTICVMNPDEKNKILFTAHADEIGLMVTNITESGALQVTKRGGIIPHTYPGQQVQVVGKYGIIYGVVEETRDLYKKDNLNETDFFIDIGTDCEEESKKLLELGAPIVLDTHIREMQNGRFTARALDDRLGVFIIMEAFKEAKRRGCKNSIYCAATVGEETTRNGAYWTGSRIEPDVAIVVDVTYTSDSHGTKDGDTGKVKLGGGPVLCNSPIVVKKYNEQLKKCAAKANIPIQIEATSNYTYTDADKIHFAGKGIPTALVSIPLRYMHSPAEVADERDVEGCIRLLAEFMLEMEK